MGCEAAVPQVKVAALGVLCGLKADLQGLILLSALSLSIPRGTSRLQRVRDTNVTQVYCNATTGRAHNIDEVSMGLNSPVLASLPEDLT